MRKKLLLADDSITIQKVVELTFPSDEFEVVTAGNGRLAVDKALTFLPDIVLCDVIMPQLDGYQVCEALRASEQLKNVPILLLNGAFEPYDAERAKAVGALGNVSKPFDPPALVARVKALLAEQAAAMAASAPQAEPLRPEPEPEPEPLMAEPMMAEPMAPEPFAELEPEPEEIAATEVPIPATTAPHDYSYEDETETNPVSTIEVPLDVREMAARSLSLDAPVFAEPEPDVLTSEPEPSDFSETLHGPLDEELGAGEPLQEIEPVEEVTPTAEISTPQSEPFAPETPAPAELDFETETDTAQSMELAMPEAMPALEAPASSDELDARESEGELEPLALEPVAAVVATDPGLSVAPDLEPSPAEPEAPSAALTLPAPPLEPEPEPEAPPAEAAGAFDGLVGPPDTPAPPPAAAAVAGATLPASDVAVPVDMVQQIAQRVISQVSERVIREIAWEVIPVIAEKLVKAEIERIKARAESERD